MLPYIYIYICIHWWLRCIMSLSNLFAVLYCNVFILDSCRQIFVNGVIQIRSMFCCFNVQIPAESAKSKARRVCLWYSYPRAACLCRWNWSSWAWTLLQWKHTTAGQGFIVCFPHLREMYSIHSNVRCCKICQAAFHTYAIILLENWTVATDKE